MASNSVPWRQRSRAPSGSGFSGSTYGNAGQTAAPTTSRQYGYGPVADFSDINAALGAASRKAKSGPLGKIKEGVHQDKNEKKQREMLEREAQLRYQMGLQLGTAGDFKDWLQSQVYNPVNTVIGGDIDPRLMAAMDRSRSSMGNAITGAQQTRNHIADYARSLNPYITGEQSIARDQGKLDQQRAMSNILGMVGAQRGSGLAGLRMAQQEAGDTVARMSADSRMQQLQEQQAARQAYGQALSARQQADMGVGGMVSDMEKLSSSMLGMGMDDRSRVESELYQRELDKQQRDYSMFNAMLGQGMGAAQMRNAQEAAQAAQKNNWFDSIFGGIAGLGGAAAKVFGG